MSSRARDPTACDTRAHALGTTLLTAVLLFVSACGSGADTTSDDATTGTARAPLDHESMTSDTTQVTPTPSMTQQATTTEAAARGALIIQGVGDLNLDPSYIPNLAANGYGFAFDRLDNLFLEDDLTVVNLECAPSHLGEPLPKAFTFRCDPDALDVARASGVDVANMANNHSLDYGLEAMLDGRDNVESAGIVPVGVGHNLQEATTPALIETQGWTVAVLGMNGVVPADWWLADSDRAGMASGDDIEQMVAAVEAAGELADLVVVSIHWMWELETEPRADDRERAEAMISAGADVVFGHHPHRLGDLEFINGQPVFWTLGNFVWPRLSDAGATTAVGRVIVSPDGSIDACMIPAFIANSGQPELTGRPPCG